MNKPGQSDRLGEPFSIHLLGLTFAGPQGEIDKSNGLKHFRQESDRLRGIQNFNRRGCSTGREAAGIPSHIGLEIKP